MVNSDELQFSTKLENTICMHIAGYNDKYVQIIKTYHMGTIRKIRTYMMDVCGNLDDARQLNYSFHAAVRDLGIDLSALYRTEPIMVLPNEQVLARRLA